MSFAPLLEPTDEGALRVSGGGEHGGSRTQRVAGRKVAGEKRVDEWNHENEANVEKGERGVRGVNSMNSMKGGFVLNLRPAPGER